MSFTRNKRDAIKHYILEQIDQGCIDMVKKTVDAFEITSTSVYRYIKEMEIDGILSKKGHKYSLIEKNGSFMYETRNVSDEMDIMERDIEPLIEKCPENVQRIWRYCLSEMINNVLDHANADRFALI